MSIRITDLPQAGTLTGAELIPVIQDGITKKAGTNQFLTLASNASNVAFTPTGGVTSTNVQRAIEELDSQKAPLDSPIFAGTVTGISKAMVGLGNADDTSDLDKPISTAQQTALDLKAPLDSPAFTGTATGLTKAMVGLENVDNTSDANKPVSTAQQTALNLKADLASPTFTGTVSGITSAMTGSVPTTQLAIPSGVATLDSSGVLVSSQIPAIAITNTYVVASRVEMLALTAQTGDVAVRSDLNASYILKGTSASTLSDWQVLLTPTDTVLSVAGRTGVVVLDKTDVGLSNVDNTSDVNKPVSTAQTAAFVGKTSDTGSALIPAGTDAQRDITPAVGAIRYNTSATAVTWEGWNGFQWVSIGGGQLLGTAPIKAISYNSQTISEYITVAAGTNAMSAGPITIDAGYTVTISAGAVWSIV